MAQAPSARPEDELLRHYTLDRVAELLSRERAHRAPLRPRERPPGTPHPRPALRAPPGSRGLAHEER